MKMSICCTTIGLAVMSNVFVSAQGTSPAKMWHEIEIEITTTFRNQELNEFTDLQALLTRLQNAAKDIAKRHDRSAIEALIRGVEIARQFPEAKRNLSRSLSILVIIAIADPKNEHDLKPGASTPGIGQWPGVTWYGAALAAINVYHDTRARDFLLAVALEDGDYGYADGAWLSPSTYATGFLRRYDAAGIRPNVETALSAEMAKEKPKMQRRPLEQHLRALVSSWDHAAEMKDAAERDRYRDFEHRLWRAWALAGGWGARKAGVPFGSAATILDKHWKDGDEHFLLRIFEESTSTVEETRIAEHLAYRLSAEGKKRLEKLAGSNSIRASFAAAALREAANRENGFVPRPAKKRNKPSPPF